MAWFVGLLARLSGILNIIDMGYQFDKQSILPANPTTAMSPIKYGIIAAILVTAVIHVFLGETLFLLNGLGYLALLALFMLPRFARWREMVFVAALLGNSLANDDPIVGQGA